MTMKQNSKRRNLIAKYHLDRLKKRYGFTGKKYGNLMQKIIANNTEAVSRAVGRISNDSYKKQFKKYRTRIRRFVLPDVAEMIPKRSVFIEMHFNTIP